MSGLIARLPELAGIRRLSRHLAESGSNARRSSIVLCAGSLALSAIEQALHSTLRGFGVDFAVLDAGPVIGEDAGNAWLGELVGWGQDPSTFSDQAARPCLPALPDVVVLRGVELLDAAGQTGWFGLMRAWADWAHQLADAQIRTRQLCVLMDAGDLRANLPASDIHLDIVWATDAHSTEDLRTQIRNGCAEDDGPLAKWLQAIVPSLAGSDLSLADRLMDTRPRTVADVEKSLREHATRRGWDGKALTRELGGRMVELGRPSWPDGQRLSAPADRLWARGLLSLSDEYGLEINSAVLAAMGERDAWHHRLWRGEVAWLLPLIDHVRLHACQSLTRAHGSDWPTRWQLPEGMSPETAHEYNPLRCELGYLKTLLRSQPALCRDGRVKPELIGQAHWIRNELAHYHPVEFAQVRELLMMVGAG